MDAIPDICACSRLLESAHTTQKCNAVEVAGGAQSAAVDAARSFRLRATVLVFLGGNPETWSHVIHQLEEEGEREGKRAR